MDFLKDDVRRLYRQFLVPSVGSALVISVYSSVDTIAVGQAEGELGTAAMAVVAPLYSFFIFLAILCGVGGSVLMSNAKGKGEEEKGNAYYTASLLMMGILTAVFWGILLIFHRQIFTFFGADEIIMPKALEYARWVIWFTPIFIAPTFLSSFIRNDGAPGLTMAAVIFGGGVNVFGDWFLVYGDEGRGYCHCDWDLCSSDSHVQPLFPQEMRAEAGDASPTSPRYPKDN